MAVRRVSHSPRRRAAEILHRFFSGDRRPLSKGELSAGLSERDADLVRELVYGVLRHRTRLDDEIARQCRFPLDRLNPPLREILEVALFQIRFLDRIPERAAVHEAAEVARHTAGEGAVGLVNGVLRSILRSAPAAIPRGDAASLAAEFSHPEFLVSRWLSRYGPERTRSILASDNRRASFHLLFDESETGARELAQSLSSDGVEVRAIAFARNGCEVISGNPLHSRAFAQGMFYVADAGAQILPRLLPPGDLLIDLAAAPGGKSVAALYSKRFSRTVSLDRSLKRLRSLDQNRRRLRLNQILPAAADALNPPLRHSSAASVLLDAPCSGTGTLRKNPEIRYRLTPEAIGELARRQAEMISAAAEIVAPGGYLLYATCSLEQEENEEVVARLLRGRADFALAPIETDSALAPFIAGARFRIFPDDGADGFSAHLLRRCAL